MPTYRVHYHKTVNYVREVEAVNEAEAHDIVEVGLLSCSERFETSTTFDVDDTDTEIITV